MNVLILTGRFGMGHVKAAEAIRESILASNRQTHVNIVDFTEYLFPSASEHIYSGFNFLVNRCSRLYNCCNRLSDRFGHAPFQAVLLHKIDRLFAFYKPDLVIATLPFCGKYISTWKQVRCSALPLYTYITDVTLHEEWISAETDLYFVAAAQTRYALLSRGIPSGKIIVSGVPVRQTFRTSNQKKIDSNRRSLHVLIMGGGLGMISCSEELLQQLHDNPYICTTVITGKNIRLAHQLRKNYPEFRILGYTEEVHRHMKEADLLITKPGGITTFEAIAAGVPIFFLPPVLEQEKANARFIEDRGIGRCLKQEGHSDAEILPGLLENPDMLETMRRNMSKLAESYENPCPLNYFTNRAG